MSTRMLSAQTLIRLWVSLLLVYAVRAWSQARYLSAPREFMLYVVVFIVAYVVDTFIWPTRVEMGREESDLVQEYLRYRKDGETMGQYLVRLEKEEEESIRLHEELLPIKSAKQTKKTRKRG